MITFLSAELGVRVGNFSVDVGKTEGELWGFTANSVFAFGQKEVALENLQLLECRRAGMDAF